MSLASIFNGATKLPSVPELVQELIDSFDDEDVKIEDIAKKLANDPVITAKILRLANSAQMGGRRKIASVNDAVVRLGFNSVRNLVLACGLAGAFDYPRTFDKKSFWVNCFEIAAISKVLAKYGQADREIAFTCGMINDIGTLLMLASFPDETENVLAAVANGEPRETLEQATLGVTASEVSAELAKRWRFPDFIGVALRWQHQPEKSKGSELAYILALSKFIQKNYLNHDVDELYAVLPAGLLEGANIKAECFSSIIHEITELESMVEGIFD